MNIAKEFAFMVLLVSNFCVIISADRSYSQSQSQPFTLSSIIPIPSRDTVGNICSWISTSVESATTSAATTAYNTISDTAALTKLGWPEYNPDACKEAKRNQDIYKTINEKLYTTNNIQELFAFLERRRNYLIRTYNLLPTHEQGIRIAEYCIINHETAMDKFLKNLFLDFIERTAKESQQVNASITQYLTEH